VIRDKLTIKRITVRGVYEYMVDTYGYNSIGTYSNFITYVGKNKLFPKDITKGHPRFDTPIGEQGQVDWKEDITLVSRNNEKFVINVMHVILKYSTYSHLDISIQKRTDDVYRCLINSFKAFGGVPAELLFDNMSTVANVTGRKKEITKNEKYYRINN
jgi:transposase